VQTDDALALFFDKTLDVSRGWDNVTAMVAPRDDFRPTDPAVLKERWSEYAKQKKLNTTAQREAIVEQFLRTQDHISIDELLARVRKRHPRVGYATVYRTLKLLVDGGLAVERQFGDGQARFEVVGEHHDHLICTSCGLILEFEDHEIEELQEKIALRLGGFTVLRHRHELYGLCPKAQGVPGGSCPRDARRK
jgi:Fur family transcriptional regulator, ferric uptake regulator